MCTVQLSNSMLTGMTMKPLHAQLQWGSGQQEVLDRVRNSYVYTDEETKGVSVRFLHVDGKAGGGKSFLLLECAVRACKDVNVLIVCPTGSVMQNIKSKLSDMEGVERIRVETLQGVLNHQSFDLDDKATPASLSLLDKCDLILMDEGAQYADEVWDCFRRSVQAEPHMPFLVIGADFQQIHLGKSIHDDLTEESRIQKFCKDIPSVILDQALHDLCFALSHCESLELFKSQGATDNQSNITLNLGSSFHRYLVPGK